MQKSYFINFRIFSIFILLFLLNSDLFTQNELDFSISGQWTDGPCTAIDTNGNIIIINNGCNFEIMEFRSDTDVLFLSKYFSQGVINSIKIKDDKVFLGLNGMGLSIVDISDLNNPSEISFLQINGYYPVIAPMGDKLLYATNSTNGLNLIDISDINSPEIIKVYDYYDVSDILVKDNYIFAVREWNGMSVFQLNEDHTLSTVSGISNKYCYDIAMTNDTLCFMSNDTLILYDISNLQVPQIIGKMKVSYAYNVDFYKKFIICSGYGMQTIDVTNINNPVIKTFDDFGKSASDMIVKNNLIFLAIQNKGFRVFKISPSGMVDPLWDYKTSGYSTGVAVKGNTAYLAQYEEGITILDITDHNDIIFEKSISHEFVTSMILKDNYLFCSNRGLKILDISNPMVPVQRSYFDLKTASWGMKIVGNLLYLASGTKGLTIIDISDVNNPKKISEIDTPGNAWDVDIRDGKAYVADQKEGIRIINISNPASPAEIASTKVVTSVYSVAVVGNYIYVGSANYGIRVLDITDPGAIYIKKYLNNSRGYKTVIDGNKAYVAGGYEGLVLLDITNPGDPVPITVFNTPGNVYDVYPGNDFVYLADYEAGFNILKKCPRFVVSSDYDFVKCHGQCDGWIDIKSVQNAIPPVQYIWNNGLNTPKIQGLCRGTYTVTITDNENCSVIKSFDINEPHALNIENLVKNDITVSNPAGSITVTISGGVTPYKYIWSGPNGFTSDQQNLTGLEKGCYTLSVTDHNECLLVSDLVCIEDKVSSMEFADAEQVIRISPNPVCTNLLVEMISPDISFDVFTIYSPNGTPVIQSKHQEVSGNKNSTNIDISMMPQGIYYLMVLDKNGKFCRNIKVVKM